MIPTKAYIIHVSDAYDREVHIQKQLKGKNIKAVFINRGDKKELTPAVLDKYFNGKMKRVTGAASCAYKHILAYHKIVENEDDVVLILEDDTRFYSNYYKMGEILNELKKRRLKNFILSLDDSSLRYIPKSKRIKDVLIYPEKQGRGGTGAYFIDKEGARSLLDHLEKEKMSTQIDWFHNLCIDKKIINMFWSQPAISVQGSVDGTTKSLIDNHGSGIILAWSFSIHRIYKKLLYKLR